MKPPQIVEIVEEVDLKPSSAIDLKALSVSNLICKMGMIKGIYSQGFCYHL
jgi:hypothetical protein